MEDTKTATLSRKQNLLRYSITVDIEAPLSMGEKIEDAIKWFSSEECAEIYGLENGIYPETEEKIIDVVNEVVNSHFTHLI